MSANKNANHTKKQINGAVCTSRNAKILGKNYVITADSMGQTSFIVQGELRKKAMHG